MNAFSPFAFSFAAPNSAVCVENDFILSTKVCFGHFALVKSSPHSSHPAVTARPPAGWPKRCAPRTVKPTFSPLWNRPFAIRIRASIRSGMNSSTWNVIAPSEVLPSGRQTITEYRPVLS